MGTTVERYVLTGDPRGFLSAVSRAGTAMRSNLVTGFQTTVAAAGGMRAITPMLGALGAATGLVGGRALQTAADFDAAMRSVQAKTGATGQVMEAMTAQAREMGRTTVHSATDAANAQAFLAQAGFSANEVMSALPGTLALASAGQLDLASAADIASNVLSGFGLGVEELDRVVDVMALTAASANVSVAQMGHAMAYAGPVASAAGTDFEETAAAIGLLGNAGFQGELGGTALRGALTKLLNPTKEAQEILDRLGVSATDSTGELLPLVDVIAQFEGAGLTAGDAMEIFGQRAGPGMLALVSQGSDALATLAGNLEGAEGTAQRMADTMSGGLHGAMRQIASITESAWISFGQRLTPALMTAADLFASLPGPMQEIIIVGGALVGSLGLLTLAFGTAWTAALGPIALVVAGVGAVGFAVSALVDAFRSANPGIEEFNEQLQSNNAEILETTGKLKEKRAELAEVRKRINDLVAAEREVPDALRRHVEELEGQIAALEDSNAALEENNAALEENKRRLKEVAIQEHTDALLEMYARYSELGEAIDRNAGKNTRAAASQRRALEVLEADIEARRTRRDELVVELDALDAVTEATDEDAVAADQAAAAVTRQGEAASETAETYTAELIPAVSLASEEVVAAHLKIRAAVADNATVYTAELIPGVQLASEAFTEAVLSIREVVANQPPTWGAQMLAGLASTWSPTNVGNVLAAAFTGGGDYAGAVAALGAQTGADFAESLSEKLGGLKDKIGGKLGGLLGGALGVALPMVGPLLGKAAGWIAGKLFGLFKKPSEAVKAARLTMQEYADTISADSVNQDRLEDWISGGFTRAHAKIVTHFQDIAIAAGESSQAGVDLWLRYQEAVEDGNQAAIDAVMEQVEAWGGVGSAAELAAATAEAAWEASINAVAPKFWQVRDAAQAAYDEAAAAAVESGATQEQAAAAGQAAWERAYAEQRELALRQMAEEEAFAAALQAVKEGNADGAIAAARRSYEQTLEAGRLAFAALEEAHDAMTEGLGDNYQAVSDDASQAATEATEAWSESGDESAAAVDESTGEMGDSQATVSDAAGTEAQASQSSWQQAGVEANRSFTSSSVEMRKNVVAAAIQMRQNVVAAMVQMRSNSQAAFRQTAAAAHAMATSINAALNRIQRSITTTHTIQTVHTSSGAPAGGGGGGGGGGGQTLYFGGAFAEGGFGRVHRPTLFLAGEAGSEDYAFSGAGRTFDGGLHDGDRVRLQLVDGGRVLAEVVAEQTQGALARRGRRT